MIPIFAIARVTFQDILRDKVLYNIFLFGIILVLISFAASQLTFMNPDRVVIDIGFSGINLACSLVAILNGSAMLGKEIERRTMFVALARPITRASFIFGKYLGLIGVIGVNWLLLSVVECILLKQAFGVFSATFFTGLALIWVQASLLAALACLVSSFTTTTVSVMILFGVYLIGNSITDLLMFVQKVEDTGLRTVLRGLVAILPTLEPYNLQFSATYHLPVENQQIVFAVLYAIGLSVLSLYGSSALIRRRES